jgi:hypothetical protein
MILKLLPSRLQNWLRPARSAGVTEVGWAIMDDRASLIWDQPKTYRRDIPRPASAKSVQVCPAALDFDARHVAVPCPVDLHLRFEKDEQGQPRLKNVAGLQSTIRSKHLQQMVRVVDRVEWRNPDRPIVQIITPYLFLADTPVWINQLPPYLEYTDPAWPGLLICGRFPIHIWPRHLMWAFEWHDLSRDLILRRGQPWFYLRFETPDPSRPVRLVETEITPEAKAYIDSISGVTNYVNRTYSLFDRARQRRPKTLLKPRTRGGSEPASDA